MKLKILSHTKPSIALCTLGSINWGAFRNPEEIKRPAVVLHRALHNLLQYQDFLTIQSKLHNEEFEPIGVGVTNLAYWLAKRKMKYGKPDALAEIKSWIEHQVFYLTEASVNLAKEKGSCKLSHLTRYGQGIFPWELRADGVNELTDFTPDENLDWEGLRSKMKEYGVRNTTVSALPPVESSSVCINSTNGISLVKQLIIIKSSKAGEFAQVVPEYRKLKKHYQLLWDQPDCIEYIKTMAVLQAYVDQGISIDTFYSGKYFPEGKIPATLIAKNLMLGHKYGLKNFYYDLRDKQGTKDLLIDAVQLTQLEDNESTCEACVL